MDLTVEDHPQRGRFEARLAGDVVGFVTYRMRDGVVELIHTEVDPDRQGQGIAGALVGRTLDKLRADGHRVRPSCPYAAGYIKRNPAYADLVVP